MTKVVGTILVVGLVTQNEHILTLRSSESMAENLAGSSKNIEVVVAENMKIHMIHMCLEGSHCWMDSSRYVQCLLTSIWINSKAML